MMVGVGPIRGDVYTNCSGKARRVVMNVYTRTVDGSRQTIVVHKNVNGTSIKETGLQEFVAFYKKVLNEA